MKKIPFISIEGPIGVGKTTLTLALAKHFNYANLKEIIYENPFLSHLYENVDEWGFQTEMFFLANRIKQLEDIQKNYLSSDKPVVADYHIIKNLIFARQTLSPRKFEQFRKVYEILTEDLPKPNVLIILNASLSTLKKRIYFRGREFELGIDESYLSELIKQYDELEETFSKLYPEVPVIKLDFDQLDIVNNQEDLDHIISKIKEII